MSLQILLSGASGVTGRALADLIGADEHLLLAGTASRRAFFEPDVEADVVIDFSHPELLDRTLSFALRRRLPLVIGTTGLDDQRLTAIRDASREIPICAAANFSVGVQVLLDLAARAAGLLGPAFDIEVLDLHHRRKIDAPSGTALALGSVLARARGLDASSSAVSDRSRHRIPRSAGEIGYQALRGGDVAGEHTVYFLADGERIELTHRAGDRRIFARGALLAAQGLVGRPAGLIEFSELILAAGKA